MRHYGGVRWRSRHPLVLPRAVPATAVRARCSTEEPALSSDLPVPPLAIPGQIRAASPAVVAGLHRFNTAPAPAAESRLLACCGSPRWARRIAGHRPYPDLDALLAAADEAYYDLTPAELAEAVAREPAVGLRQPAAERPDVRSAGFAARAALQAAHAAYESRFGHSFVICLDGLHADEMLDHVLAAIRTRLGHDQELERTVTADELRRVVRGRLARQVARYPQA